MMIDVVVMKLRRNPLTHRFLLRITIPSPFNGSKSHHQNQQQHHLGQSRSITTESTCFGLHRRRRRRYHHETYKEKEGKSNDVLDLASTLRPVEKYDDDDDDDKDQHQRPQHVHYLLAHMNYARLKAPLSDPSMEEFRHALQPINDIAKSTPGFVWSLDLDDYQMEQQRSQVDILSNDSLLMPQLSLWTDVESIQRFAFKSGHAMYLKRSKEWFTSPPSPFAVCWWWKLPTSSSPLSSKLTTSSSSSISSIQQSEEQTPNYSNTLHGQSNNTIPSYNDDIYPTLKDAFQRLDMLCEQGPTKDAFTFKTSNQFPKPT